MDSHFHWLWILGGKMTFEKAGREIKKEHKICTEINIRKNQSGVTTLFFVKNNLNKYEHS